MNYVRLAENLQLNITHFQGLSVSKNDISLYVHKDINNEQLDLLKSLVPKEINYKLIFEDKLPVIEY